MPFEYLEDSVTSDVTFHAWADDLDTLFAAAADATTQVMVAALDAVRPLEQRSVTVSADALDILLWRFLEELVFLKDADRLLLRPATVHVEAGPGACRAQAHLQGEPIDPTRHQLAADVKAVTLHGLQVEQHDGTWHAQVTLDV